MVSDSMEMFEKQTSEVDFKDVNLDDELTENGTVRVIKPQLEKTVSMIGGIGLVVGSIIGSGIFLSPKNVLLETGSVGLSLCVWLLCGLIALFGALCYVELGTEIPLSGAEYSYLYDAFKQSILGRILAFLYSWTATLIIRPSAVAIIATIFAEYVSKPFYDDGVVPIWVIKTAAFICIVIITVVNCISVRWAVIMQNVFTAAKLVGVAIIIVIGFIEIGKGNFKNFEKPFEGSEKNIFTISKGFYSGLWAYDGWNTLNFVTEEMHNPSRDMPRTLIISMSIVIICYLLCNVSYILVLGGDQIAKSSTVALDVANAYLGKASVIIPILVGLSCFGAVNGLAFSSGRLVYAAAREGHLPKVLSMVQMKRRTPIPSLIFTAVISIIMLIPNTSQFETLVGLFSFASWLFYGACFVVLLYLRFSRKTMIRPYKVFLPIPVIMVAVSVFLIVFPFLGEWIGCTIALGVILLGIPVYIIFVHVDILKYAPNVFQNCAGSCVSKSQRTFGMEFPTDESFFKT